MSRLYADLTCRGSRMGGVEQERVFEKRTVEQRFSLTPHSKKVVGLNLPGRPGPVCAKCS